MIWYKERLAGVDERLIQVIVKVSEIVGIRILEGLRAIERQKLLVEQGRSKTLDSKHIIGEAVDMIMVPFDGWGDVREGMSKAALEKAIDQRCQFHYFAGLVVGTAHSMGVNIRWGGDWDRDHSVSDNNFDDLPHFELV